MVNNMLSGLVRWVGQFADGAAAMGVKALLAPVSLGALALILDEKGQVGLVRHSYRDGWSLPGGGVARGEPPVQAVLRELREELGTVESDPPELFGLYSQSYGWATNVVVLYRLTNARVTFRPNLEVRELVFVDPLAPPEGTTGGTRRRLAELVHETPLNPYW